MSDAETADAATAPMQRIDVAALIAPIHADDPCGPDLEEQGDLDFSNFHNNGASLLDQNFFAFDRAKAKLPEWIAEGEKLFARSRDVRLSTMIAKFAIIDRNLALFVRHLVALARLLETRWETLRPAPYEGDHSYMLSFAQSLDDLKTTGLPLEHLPVARHARLGVLNYRMQLVSSGAVAPRVWKNEDEEEVTETYPDVEEIARAMADVAIDDLAAMRDQLLAAEAALALMREVSIAHVGHKDALTFKILAPKLKGMAEWLDRCVALRDPARALNPAAAAEPGDGGDVADAASSAPQAGAAPSAPGISPPVESSQDAAAALAALDAYFARCEPSNPALLLVRQAAQLVGKSYLDALRTLAPSFTDSARIALGRIDALAVQVERLADFATIDPSYETSTIDYAPANRADAVALMGATIAYFTRAEPSSPAPLLLERAQRMCGKDFLSILREMLPPDALKP